MDEEIRERRELEDFNAEIAPVVYNSSTHYLVLIEKLQIQESMGGEEFRLFIDDMRDMQSILIDIQRKIDLVEDIYEDKIIPQEDDPRPSRKLIHQLISNYRTLSNAHDFEHLHKLLEHLEKKKDHFQDEINDSHLMLWFKKHVRELES